MRPPSLWLLVVAVNSLLGFDEQRRSLVDSEMLVTVGVDMDTELLMLVVVLGPAGRLLETRSFPATTRGYARLATWAESFGEVDKVGMEGTGSFGAGLLRFLADYGLTVIEVDRPDLQGAAATASPIPWTLSPPPGLSSCTRLRYSQVHGMRRSR